MQLSSKMKSKIPFYFLTTVILLCFQIVGNTSSFVVQKNHVEYAWWKQQPVQILQVLWS